jgi:heptosyltransferase-2
MGTLRRCLIVGPSWIGDMLMAQSLFKVLAARHPGVRLDVLAPAWSLGILARMPEVGGALVAPFGHRHFGLSERWRLGRQLAAGSYERAVILPNSWKSALVPFFARIPERVGYVGEWRFGLLTDARRLDKSVLPRLAARYAALAGPQAESQHGVPAPPPPRLQVVPQAQRTALGRLGLNLGQPVLALCPGAEYGPAKRWPPRHFAAVARAMLGEGWQVWLFGSGRDATLCAAIRAELGDAAAVHDLAGRTSLEECVDLLACTRAVVSNDSGLMHVAAAVGTPLVAIYGSTDPGYTPPLSDQARVLRLGLACSPCLERECPLGHMDCLNRLSPAQVLEALPR